MYSHSLRDLSWSSRNCDLEKSESSIQKTSCTRCQRRQATWLTSANFVHSTILPPLSPSFGYGNQKYKCTYSFTYLYLYQHLYSIRGIKGVWNNEQQHPSPPLTWDTGKDRENWRLQTDPRNSYHGELQARRSPPFFFESLSPVSSTNDKASEYRRCPWTLI